MFDKLANLIYGEEDNVDWMQRQVCPHDSCNREMYLRDIPQHWVRGHGEDVDKYKSKVLDTSDTSGQGQSHHKVRLRDLVDDYDADWLRDETDDSIELQEASGGHELRSKKLQKRWQPVIKALRQRGEFVITRQTHVGKLRGGHIKQRFLSDLKRMDIELDVEVKGKGYPIKVRKV